MNVKYNEYKALLQKIADVNYSSAVLQWDQEVYMPPNGATYRAQQLATLAGIAHELATDKKLENLLLELQKDTSLEFKEKANVLESLRIFYLNKKYTTDFVIELNKTISQSFVAWQQAKAQNNFQIFKPHLKALIDLKKKECELLGYDEHPYDALLNLYEPGLKTSFVTNLFLDVKERLVPFVQSIIEKQRPDTSFLHLHYDKQRQWDFGIEILKQINYDFEAGRQDISTHPFTTNFSAQDVRVTTRINETDLFEMIGSCIHEGGHALYEQGLNATEYGLPSGEYLSLSIHESQSRLLENCVGRSLAFWKHNYPRLQNVFNEQLGSVSLEKFYHGINAVQPSLIRTNADELTYHFHVMIRFEMEKEIIEGTLGVDDLPEAWNSKYKAYLGIDVPDDAQGILQDVHWSHGSFGYFPTYSLGSFYAAQFYSRAKKEVSNLELEIENGNTLPLLKWLREKIHRHGRTIFSDELCKNVTGEVLNFNYFYDSAVKKYTELYP